MKLFSLLQPDITAPGLNILAAWTGASPASATPGDHRIVKYNFDSGTSMSCPHVSAVAALLKAIHPEWSSAAIRSAIMTTGIFHGFNLYCLPSNSIISFSLSAQLEPPTT